MINDEIRKDFIDPTRHFPRLRDVVWISSTELIRELKLLSNARFDKYAGHTGEELCDRYPDCGLAVFRSEDCRAGKEL